MNNNDEELLKQIQELKNENELLKNTLIQTQEHLKQQAATELGYIYELWIYNRKGERVKTNN